MICMSQLHDWDISNWDISYIRKGYLTALNVSSNLLCTRSEIVVSQLWSYLYNMPQIAKCALAWYHTLLLRLQSIPFPNWHHHAFSVFSRFETCEVLVRTKIFRQEW